MRPSPPLAAALDRRDHGGVAASLGVEAAALPAPLLWQARDAGLDAPMLLHLQAAVRPLALSELGLTALLRLWPLHGPQLRAAPVAACRALAAAWSGSAAARRYLQQDPQLVVSLSTGAHLHSNKGAVQMRTELRRLRAGATNPPAFLAALRRYRVHNWVRLVARTLGELASTEQVLAELSDLAEAIIAALVVQLLRRERSTHGPWQPARHAPRRRGLAVLAQGKLGGRELNLSSDVDLQFISCNDLDDDADLILHQRHTRVAQAMVQQLSRGPAGDSFCYRVDLDLRPEGKKGALVNTLAGAEHYYETWGLTWERLALIRARVVAGSAWIGTSLLRALRPFIYPRSADALAVAAMRDLKDRIFADRRRLASRADLGAEAAADLKRGPGGIRDIELFVHILQHLHGGHLPRLRQPALLPTLAELPLTGVLPLAEARALSRAYVFWRHLENLVQAQEEQQVHHLPTAPAALTPLAQIWRRHVLRRPLARADRDPEVLRRRLAQACSRRRHTVLRLIRPLLGMPRRRPRHGPEQLYAADLARAPDPHQAAQLLAALQLRMAGRPGGTSLLERVPQVRRRLIDLLGTSAFLGQLVVQHPEMLDWFASPETLAQMHRLHDRTALRQEARSRLARLPDDLILQMRSLRRFKLQAQLRIGCLDVLAGAGIDQVMHALSDLADVCLQESLALAHRSLDLDAAAAGFLVLGLGRLGAQEMGYGSDLDLLFVYDADRCGDARQPVRLAQRLIQVLTLAQVEGSLYPIDTRLRPSGNQGPLVCSDQALLAHHAAPSTASWERQALLRARVVAGDAALGTRLLARLADRRYPAQLPPETQAEVVRVRARLEAELAQEGPGRVNLKVGRGGLMDVTHIVQLLQLRHAHAHPPLRATNTLALIEALMQARLLRLPQGRALRRNYLFLRAVEARLRIVHDRPDDRIDFAAPSTAALARRLGYAGPQGARRLARAYLRATTQIRTLYLEIVGRSAPGAG